MLNAAAGVQITVTGGGMVDLTGINAGYAQFSVSAVLDANGVIRWSYLSPVDVNPGADGVLTALEALPRQPAGAGANTGAAA